MAEIDRTKIADFERNRAQLMNVSAQKQQLQIQSLTLKQSLEELAKTKEKKVFKAVGNILIQKDTASVKKELKERKESVELRLKTLQKQEDSLVNKLNKIRSEIETGAKAADEEKGKEDKK